MMMLWIVLTQKCLESNVVNYSEDASIVIGGADNASVDRIGARDLTPWDTKLNYASNNTIIQYNDKVWATV